MKGRCSRPFLVDELCTLVLGYGHDSFPGFSLKKGFAMTFVESACFLNPLSSTAHCEPNLTEDLEDRTKTRLKAVLGEALYIEFFATLRLVRIHNGCAVWSLPVPPTYIHIKYKNLVVDCMKQDEIRDIKFSSRGAVIKKNLSAVRPASPKATLQPVFLLPFKDTDDTPLPEAHPVEDLIETLCEDAENETISVHDEDSNQPRRLFIEAIQHIVANYYGLTIHQLRNRTRTRELTKPRQVAIYLCSQLIKPHSLPKIGKHFGRRDHTTILHSVRKIAELILTDETLARDVHLLTERICLEHRMPLHEEE